MNQEELKQRLIELLNETFAEQYDKRGLLTAPHTAEALIANGVTIREWIPVTERLPEKMQTQIKRGAYRYDKSVRVLCVCRQKSGKTIVKEGYCEFFNNGVYWSIPGSIDSVTHWMPLPEPPEAEKGDEGK